MNDDAAHEKAELCARAAAMRAEGKSYTTIAKALSLSSPNAAREYAEVGYGFLPAADVEYARNQARRRRAQLGMHILLGELDALAPEDIAALRAALDRHGEGGLESVPGAA